jgi:hypothetical protein
MGTVATKPTKERNPGPYTEGRRCECGCILSRSNPGPSCAPCSGGQWVSPVDPVIALATAPNLRQRVEIARAIEDLAA